MADATPKDVAPIPAPKKPEPEQLLPPTGPFVPDELADFFDVGGAELAKPEQILADVQEARKDGFARRREVNETITDPENPQVKQGRELGATLVKGLTGEVEPSRVNLMLGETTAERLQAAETADVDAVIEVLSRELRELDGGRKDIFKNLGDAEATAAVGVQRRTDQQRVVALKSTLLGMSEEAFTAGDYERGLAALQAARVDMISAEPAWLVQTMAESVAKADLEEAEVRAALVKILDSRVLGTTSDMEAKVTSMPLDKLSGQEVVLKKGLEARAINQKIEAEAQEAKLKAEYEEKMETAWDRKMAAAVTDGRGQFKEHFEGGNSYGVRFKDYGEGSSHLANLLKDWHASAEVTGDHRLARVDGYLQVLENIMETPGYLDKFVARGAEMFHTDLGGKSKTDYEREGKILEWNEHIRRQILTEIHGNALGILLGAVEYEGRGINDQIRALTLRRSLEVLGRGQALEGLIAGKGDLTPEQTLIRKALLEYVNKPIGAQEKLVEDEQAVVQRRLARLKGLKDAASQADITILQKREDAKKLAKLKEEEEERRRGDLKNKVGKSQEHLRTIDEAKEKMLDVEAKGQRIEGLSDAVVDYVLKIDRQDKSKPPTVNVSVNEARTKEINERIRLLKEKLAKNPPNSRELRDELAMGEVSLRFIQEVREWVNGVNGPSYKRVFMDAGLFGKSKGAISVTAFDSIPDPGSDQRWYGYSDEITTARQEVDKPRTTSDRQKPKTLAELKQQVDAQTQAENLLEIYGDVDQTERELFDRVTQAKKAIDTLLQRADKAIVSLARDFVKRRLEALLRSEKRLSYS